MGRPIHGASANRLGETVPTRIRRDATERGPLDPDESFRAKEKIDPGGIGFGSDLKPALLERGNHISRQSQFVADTSSRDQMDARGRHRVDRRLILVQNPNQHLHQID